MSARERRDLQEKRYSSLQMSTVQEPLYRSTKDLKLNPKVIFSTEQVLQKEKKSLKFELPVNYGSKPSSPRMQLSRTNQASTKNSDSKDS